ncbi:hypothetical protein [Enterobacter phage fGh-Ecl01]|nr:hypothetical protein [Enterobacter phage fGh-Ecl01]
MTLNQLLIAANNTYDNTKPQAEIKDCLPGTLVVKSANAVLHCEGPVREALDAGEQVVVVVPPFNDKHGAVTIGVGTLTNSDFKLIRLTNVKHAVA